MPTQVPSAAPTTTIAPTVSFSASFSLVVQFGDVRVDADLAALVVGAALETAVNSIDEVTDVAVPTRRRLSKKKRHLRENRGRRLEGEGQQIDVVAVVSLPVISPEARLLSEVKSAQIGDAMVVAARANNVLSEVDDETIRSGLLVDESLALMETSLSLSTLAPTISPTSVPTLLNQRSATKKKSSSNGSSLTLILAIALIVLLVCVALPTLTVCYRSSSVVHVNGANTLLDRGETSQPKAYVDSPPEYELVQSRGLPPLETYDDEEAPPTPLTMESEGTPSSSGREPNLHDYEWEQMMSDVDEELAPEAWNEEVASLILFRLARLENISKKGFAPRSELASLLELRPDLAAMLGLPKVPGDALASLLADVRSDDNDHVSRSQFLHAVALFRSRLPATPSSSYSQNNPLLLRPPPTPWTTANQAPQTPVYTTPRQAPRHNL